MIPNLKSFHHSLLTVISFSSFYTRFLFPFSLSFVFHLFAKQSFLSFLWYYPTLFISFNPIIHTWFRDSFTCDGSSAVHVFSLLFNIVMVIKPYQSSLPNRWRFCCHAEGGGLPVQYWGWGQSDDSKYWLCNHSKSGMVVKAGLPCRFTEEKKLF